MRNALLMAFRYLGYYRVRSIILVVCLSVVLFLPLAVHTLTGYYTRMMIERAQTTPMVFGAPGSAYDLVLNTVYFKGRLDRRITMAVAKMVSDSHLAAPVPMYVRYSAGGRPIVGTTLDYFAFRKLTPERGTLPLTLGDVVLGAGAARELNLGVGDSLLSDDKDLYNLASSYPLLMRVVGVLHETDTADDMVVFADLKTTWIIEGLGHGHADARSVRNPIMSRGMSDNNITLTRAVVHYNRITPERLNSFHFHGDLSSYPITGVIALPRDKKSEIILAARYAARNAQPDPPPKGDGPAGDAASQPAEPLAPQAVRPRKVVADMMDIIFRVKQSFQAILAVVLASTVGLLALVVLLSLRIRRREFQTLHRIGCRRLTVLALQTAEISLLLTMSLALSAGMLAGAMWYVVRFNVLL